MAASGTASLSTDTPLILIVDDCDENREILSVLLAPLEAQILEARTGEDALKTVRTTKPALILLDVNMPGMSGFEVCEALRKDSDTRDITVLFVSALGDLENRVRGLSGGGVDYISKPFEPDEVLARVSTQLELHGLRTQLVLRNQELEELIREKDRFLDLAAHGLRHPLMQVRGLIGLLRSGQLGEQGRETLVDTIAGASERMNHILNDVFEVHDLETGTLSLKPEPVAVQNIFRKCLDIWEHRARSRELDLQVRMKDLPEARYDKEKLTQVLETIVAQAVESAPRGARITFELADSNENFRLAVSGWPALARSYAGLVDQAEQADSQTISNSVVAKLVRHFGGKATLFEGDQPTLLLDLPLHTGFSENSSNCGRG